MANWCSTNITFYSENKEQITKLHSVLSELDAGESLLSNDFGNLWLGNILHRFGYKWQEITCRGSITLLGSVYEDADGRFCFEVEEEDAWAPMTGVWDTVLSEEEYSDIEYVYIAEESGCNVYINSDTSGLFYDIRYVIDSNLEGKFLNDKTLEFAFCPMYFSTERGCLAYLKKISEALGNKQDFTTVNEANDWFVDFLDDDASWVSVNEFQPVWN